MATEEFGMKVKFSLVPDNLDKTVSDVKKKFKDIIGKLPGGAIGGAVAGGGGVAAGILILRKIHGNIEKMSKTMEQANAAFKGSKEIVERMWNIALRPMGNIMTVLMRPFLLLAMKFMQPKLKQMQAILARTGGQPQGADLEELMSIWQETSTGLQFFFKDMLGTIQPIIAEIDGFKAGLDIIMNTWFTGVTGWVSGFLKGLDTEGIKTPPEVAKFLIEAAESNPEMLENLPGTIADKFEAYLVNPTSENTFNDVVAHFGSRAKSWIDNAFNKIDLPRGQVTTITPTRLSDFPKNAKAEDVIGASNVSKTIATNLVSR